MTRAAALAAALALAAGQAAGQPVLVLPVDCVPGDTCHVQHLVDRDPGPGARDAFCGTLTYDGHKGTDLALPTLADMARGVAVMAAAAGVVAATRDGMADARYAESDAEAVAGRECGNGVVLSHADGWETQYCHLRAGSVAVRQGEAVAAGQMIGLVGLSGKTQFPHLHLSVRRDGAVVDPFLPDPRAHCGATDPDLWQVTPVAPPGGVNHAGFAEAVPDYDAVRSGTAGQARLRAEAPALVLFGLAFGVQAGDVMRLEIAGPGGTVLARDEVLTRAQAQVYRAAGRRRAAADWPAGTYAGTVTLSRGGIELSRRSVEMRIP